MTRIVQISDLHLLAFKDQFTRTIEPLVHALALFHARDPVAPDLLTITGDVFDSSDLDPVDAVERFTHLLDRFVEALGGGPIPTVLLPGNHDRRWSGIVGRFDTRLFERLRGALEGRAWVTGCTIPYLAELIPRSFHKLPFPLVTFDSTYNPTGLVGAGGVVRQEDLLQLADRLRDEPDHEPLVVLTHHHLIPTPLTDWARVDVDTESKVLRWFVKNVVARLVSNADHEELTMTALGAGTALSSLHAFGRPVLVLHGHKHNPSARALRATTTGQGDVLLASAGSAGTVLSWNATDDPEVAHLWPSFCVCDVDGDDVSVRSVAFSPKRTAHDEEPTRVAIRPLLSARRQGLYWHVEPVAPEPENIGPTLSSNRASYRVQPNAHRGSLLWDLVCERHVTWHDGPPLRNYAEMQEGPRGARIVDLVIGEKRLRDRNAPAKLHLPVDGTRVGFRMLGGACRSLDEVRRAYGDLTAFEWVDLLNRYWSREATLTLEGLPDDGGRPFGSAVDLTTGLERPLPVVRENGRVVLRIENCPPRTLLKVLWPLRS